MPSDTFNHGSVGMTARDRGNSLARVNGSHASKYFVPQLVRSHKNTSPSILTFDSETYMSTCRQKINAENYRLCDCVARTQLGISVAVRSETRTKRSKYTHEQNETNARTAKTRRICTKRRKTHETPQYRSNSKFVYGTSGKGKRIPSTIWGVPDIRSHQGGFGKDSGAPSPLPAAQDNRCVGRRAANS